MNNLISIDHINLSVKNFNESAKWYKDVFGFEIVEHGVQNGETWGVLKANDTMLCIYEEGDKKPSRDNDSTLKQYHRIYHFGLRIKSKKEWEKILNRMQIKTYYNSPRKYPFSTSWYIQDPSGLEIEVTCWDENIVKFTEQVF